MFEPARAGRAARPGQAAGLRHHPLQHEPDEKQWRNDAGPSPSGEPIAVVLPNSPAHSPEAGDQGNRSNHRPDNTCRCWQLREQHGPRRRPRYGIQRREPAPAGPVRRVRYRLSCDEQPHEALMHKPPTGSTAGRDQAVIRAVAQGGPRLAGQLGPGAPAAGANISPDMPRKAPTPVRAALRLPHVMRPSKCRVQGNTDDRWAGCGSERSPAPDRRMFQASGALERPWRDTG